ncbi:DUF1176 domain-containing protein [Erythrobacter sp. BLCC-B19]|uniref:DUF1176 domain-containing protein n=1 Tax=Erythrobacter sp. BLCC-B19 TaxID=3025315 RepID=UPI00236105D6|nr:DUF1176 domain-containing protein [Erythrobacter sp. BLCC-B19]WDA39805.1 DUF1176 domain-containing protein [Erythrobacter sp. BLCC-B19]
MARASLAALALVLAASTARAEDSAPGDWTAPEVTEFSDWSVACDNARECTAVSISRAFVARVEANDPGDYAQPRLWVKRRAGPDEPVRVFLDTTTWGEAGAGPGPVLLHVLRDCDGECVGPAYPLIALEPGRYELAPPYVATFLAESTTTSHAATRFADGEMHGIITTAGMTAALRFIDEVQERRETVTAIFAKGPRPASTVPPAPRLPEVKVTRGEEAADNAVPAVNAALFVEQARLCPDVDLDGPDPFRARWRLASGQFLWSLGCSGNPDAPRRLWLIETPGKGVATFTFPRPEQGRAALPPVLPDSAFDPASGMITAYAGRLCGWRRRWTWTGTAFEMVDAVEMPSCFGIPLHQWLQTYRAVPD